MIDVKELMASANIDELNRKTDLYFKQFSDRSLILSKPFVDLNESPEIILQFFHVLKGLRVDKGDTILDFGAGSCWSTRLLANFGYRAIGMDVSETALEIGRELLETHKILTDHVRPEFLIYDGYRLPLNDSSVDGIMVLSAFHHLPNPDEILAEFYRVLKPSGVLGCAEPGPNHSKTPQSQMEMSNYGVIENDILIEHIWNVAQELGFSNIFLSVYYPELYMTTLSRFTSFIHGSPLDDYDTQVRNLMSGRRQFFLEKGDLNFKDSSQPEGLQALVSARTHSRRVRVGEALVIEFKAENTGQTIWRPSDSQVGPVRIGISIQQEGSEFRDFSREPLPKSGRVGIYPGESVRTRFNLALPETPGKYKIKVGLLSELVRWFDAFEMIEIIVE